MAERLRADLHVVEKAGEAPRCAVEIDADADAVVMREREIGAAADVGLHRDGEIAGREVAELLAEGTFDPPLAAVRDFKHIAGGGALHRVFLRVHVVVENLNAREDRAARRAVRHALPRGCFLRIQFLHFCTHNGSPVKSLDGSRGGVRRRGSHLCKNENMPFLSYGACSTDKIV